MVSILAGYFVATGTGGCFPTKLFGECAQKFDLIFAEVVGFVLAVDGDEIDTAGFGCVHVDHSRSSSLAFATTLVSEAKLAQHAASGDRGAFAGVREEFILQNPELVIVQATIPSGGEDARFNEGEFHYTTQ